MTVVRRSRTIIFDLYGTLLPGGSRLRRDAIAFQMADVLEVDRKKFADVVRDTFDERVRGTMGGLSETISELAQRVGFQMPDEKEKRHGQAIAAASLPAV